MNRDRRQLVLMLAPYLAGLALLVLLPATATMTMAFTHTDLIATSEFIGLDNFAELARDPAVHAAVGNSLSYLAYSVPLRLVLAVGLALLLHRRTRGAGTARAAVLLPGAVPELAYGLMWLWLLNPLQGPVNQLLLLGGENGRTMFGTLPPQWLTDPEDARAGIVLMSLFTIGETFVIVLTARLALPPEAYEIAELEGARAGQVLRRVTLPLLAPVLAVLVLRDTVASLQASFIPALVVTNGGPPPYATTYLSLVIYQEAFEYLRYGYAAAVAALTLILTVMAVLIQWRLLRRWAYHGLAGMGTHRLWG
ncbi:sugar ABC transporter permease [Saccharothrix algeriensis]|uniref:Sugar ABC transporter permease n=2 Tax=Catellatospora bangladeshensis TaxID=310355 RepID=A0A8J3NJY9_9ACTN|nr:sugar ABC transporter permease [Catellatospora bangladeshensis]